MSVHPTIEVKTKDEYIKSSIIVKYANLDNDIIEYTDKDDETYRDKIYAYIFSSSTATGLFEPIYIITLDKCIKYLYKDFTYLTDDYDVYQYLKIAKKNLKKNKNIIEIQ